MRAHVRVRARSARSRPAALRIVCSADAKRVVILGGTGRVGSATAASLLENFPHYEVVLGGRKQESYDNICKLRPSLQKARFVQCDINSRESVKVSLARVVWMHAS